MKPSLGETCFHIRTLLGLTQRAAAKKIGISFVHLSNIENDKAIPSFEMLEKIRIGYGVDVYMFAWCQSGDVAKLPAPIRKAAKQLTAAWKADIQKRLKLEASTQ